MWDCPIVARCCAARMSRATRGTRARSFVAAATPSVQASPRPRAPEMRRMRRAARQPSPHMSQTLHPMLNIAIKAARAAGALINRASLDIEKLQVQTKSTNDFVTEVDQAAERVIIETILQAYPGHGILAEESGRSM